MVFHKNFKKQYKKLPEKVKIQFNIRLQLYLENPTSPILNIHKLHGQEEEFTSMNVTADFRAIFTISKNVTTFYKIGTHSELYS